MGPSLWLSSIASWKERSSSRFKVGRIEHTAPKKENVQRRKKNCAKHPRPHSSTGHYSTERNHPTGPQSTAKVDQSLADADSRGDQPAVGEQACRSSTPLFHTRN